MNKKLLLSGYRLIVAIVVLAAVCTQFIHSHASVTGFSAVNFFSFFTVESNIFGAIIFIAAATSSWRGIHSTRLLYLRGAATLYMVITGIIYSLLLTGVDVQASVPWCNAILHYIFPILIFIDWCFVRSKVKLSYKKTLFWLLFPFTYAIYCLIRGPLANHWYPYPFINAAQFGYEKVLMNCIIIAIGCLVLALVLTKIVMIKPQRTAKRARTGL